MTDLQKTALNLKSAIKRCAIDSHQFAKLPLTNLPNSLSPSIVPAFNLTVSE